MAPPALLGYVQVQTPSHRQALGWLVALAVMFAGTVFLPRVFLLFRGGRRYIENVCGKCGYPLHGLPTPVCPECGSDTGRVGTRLAVGPSRAARWWAWGAWVVALMTANYFYFWEVDNYLLRLGWGVDSWGGTSNRPPVSLKVVSGIRLGLLAALAAVGFFVLRLHGGRREAEVERPPVPSGRR